MEISECKGKIKVGDRVKTNGNSFGVCSDGFFEGEIGEITDITFYVWQNEMRGVSGTISPSSKGYRNSWVIRFDNPIAEIEIIKNSSSDESLISRGQKTMNKITSTLKRILSPELQAQYKAGYRNGELALTEKGRNELLEILAKEKEVELTASAQAEIDEEEKK